MTLANTTLAPGEGTIGVMTYSVLDSDLPGPLVNRVSVTGKPIVGTDVSSEATVTVPLLDDESSLLYLPILRR